jgi:hypothetical protein
MRRLLPLIFVACSSVSSTPVQPSTFASPAAQHTCPRLDRPVVTGAVVDPRLPEISSVLVSRKHPGTLWVLNDSGNAAVLFAITTAGTVVGSYTVEGAQNLDWEGLGQRFENGKHWLYIADTGDNLHIRNQGTVYIVEEPDTLVQGGSVRVTKEVALSYASNKRENVEAFAVEPTSGAFYFFSRGDEQGVATLFRRDASLEKVNAFSFKLEGVRGSDLTTSADFDSKGERFIMRTYVAAYLWTRDPNESWTSAFARTPCLFALDKDTQGEAIAFDDSGFFTLSEKLGAPIRHYALHD